MGVLDDRFMDIANHTQILTGQAWSAKRDANPAGELVPSFARSILVAMIPRKPGR